MEQLSNELFTQDSDHTTNHVTNEQDHVTDGQNPLMSDEECTEQDHVTDELNTVPLLADLQLEEAKESTHRDGSESHTKNLSCFVCKKMFGSKEFDNFITHMRNCKST